VAERVEPRLAVVCTRATAPDATERRGRRNHLRGKVVARDSTAARVADEVTELVVVGPVPVGDERCGPSVDVVDRLGQFRVRPHHQNGAEDLLAGDLHSLVDVAHDGGGDLAGVSIRKRFTVGPDSFDASAVDPGVLDQAHHPVEVGLVHRRAVVVVVDDRRKHAAQGVLGGVDERVHPIVGHEHVVGAHADLSPIDHARLGDSRCGPRQIRVPGDHDGILAAELERHGHQVMCGGLLHHGADGRRSGEEQVVERQPREFGGDVCSAGDDVELCGIEVVRGHLLHEFGGARGDLTHLDHHPVARRERRRRGQHDEVDRKVPRADDSDDTQRAGLDLGTQAEEPSGPHQLGGPHPLRHMRSGVLDHRDHAENLGEHGSRLGPGAVIGGHRLDERVGVVEDKGE
jgi:hypothetical protein